MPNLIICYKWVLDEQDIKFNPTTLALDTSRAKKKISEYDKNALEIATRLVESQGGQATAIAYGLPDTKQSVKEVLSRGANKALWVSDSQAEQADAFVTANVLSAAIQQAGDYDLIICGAESADVRTLQIPARVGTLLGIPVVTEVIGLDIIDKTVTVTRRVNDSIETIIIDGPAVISVLPEICEPRIPNLKAVMAANKKPQQEIKVADLGLAAAKLTPKITVKNIRAFVMERKNVIYAEGTAQAKVTSLLANLTKENLM